MRDIVADFIFQGAREKVIKDNLPKDTEPERRQLQREGETKDYRDRMTNYLGGLSRRDIV